MYKETDKSFEKILYNLYLYKKKIGKNSIFLSNLFRNIDFRNFMSGTISHGLQANLTIVSNFLKKMDFFKIIKIHI